MVWLQPVSIYDLLVYLLQPGYAYKDICEAIEYSCYNWHIAVFFKVPHTAHGLFTTSDYSITFGWFTCFFLGFVQL